MIIFIMTSPLTLSSRSSFPNFGLPALVGKDLTISASAEDLEKVASRGEHSPVSLPKIPIGLEGIDLLYRPRPGAFLFPFR
jgi:hypothetical protein